MLLLYCIANPLILSPVGSGAFSSKERQDNPTGNGRVHRARFKTVPSRPLRFSLWQAPLAEITQNANSFRGTPETLQVIWHQTGLLSGVVLDWGARDLEFARCGLIVHGVARLAPSGDGVKYDLYRGRSHLREVHVA